MDGSLAFLWWLLLPFSSLFHCLMLIFDMAMSSFPVKFPNPGFYTSNCPMLYSRGGIWRGFCQDGSKRWLRWLWDLKPELALRTWSSERTKTGSPWSHGSNISFIYGRLIARCFLEHSRNLFECGLLPLTVDYGKRETWKFLSAK